MPQSAVFIDNIVTKPLTGECVLFESRSGGEVLHFAMEKITAIKAAYDILRAVTESDLADLGELPMAEVIPFPEARSQYRRAS